jgi:ferric-dicitrate binding protein FerR (iron transport regulator)
VSRALCFLGGFLVVLALASAQSQIATVTSGGPFELRGAKITPGLGVSAWPVMEGDVIKSGSSFVTVTLRDGSVITLNPGAEIRIDMSGSTPVIQLLNGTLSYSLKTTDSIQLMVRGQPIPLTAVSGTYTFPRATSSTSWWTTRHTVLVVAGVGAAAGLGAGISAATSGGTSVSPSN